MAAGVVAARDLAQHDVLVHFRVFHQGQGLVFDAFVRVPGFHGARQADRGDFGLQAGQEHGQQVGAALA